MGRIKGSHVVELVKLLRKNREAASAALPEALHRYLNERILESSWYPELDHVELMRAVIAVVPQLDNDAFELFGELGARRDFEQQYSHVLDSADPDFLARRSPVLWQMFHDTGELVVHRVGERSLEIEIAGYTSDAWELCRCTAGYFRGLFAAVGARGVEVSKLSCTLLGAAACRLAVKWQAGG